MPDGGSFASPTAVVTPTAGARRYTFLRRLAVGGMGELLLAHASAPGGVQKLVAIKRVRPEYASDEEFVKMFLNEARLAATLDHPNVVRTYDLVEDDSGFLMVMEYLHGESLGKMLNAVVQAGERVPLAQVVTIVLGVAAGLHCAHERRGVDGRPLDIVHRDLSPGNVFMTYEGGVKLLDFGIAKATSRTSITIGPSRKGKVSYMSPEQCTGHDVDRRSDIFSLGIVMWELVTGRRLFRGDNEFSIMNQITTTDAPSILEHAEGLPDALAEIIRRALQRDREDRFQTAMELHEALEALAAREGLRVSAPALGRYLEMTCGWRELPSAEPTPEFAAPERSTLVVQGSTVVTPPPRKLGFIWALVGGVVLGGIVVGGATWGLSAGEDAAAQRSPAEQTPVATAREGDAASASEQAPDPAEPPESGNAAPAGQDHEASPGPAPAVAEAADVAVAVDGTEEAEAEVEPATTSKSKAKAKSRRRKKKAAPSEPAADPAPGKPARGVDGILPSG